MSRGFDRLRVVVAASVAGTSLVPAAAQKVGAASTVVKPAQSFTNQYSTGLGSGTTHTTVALNERGLSLSEPGGFGGVTLNGFGGFAAMNTIACHHIAPAHTATTCKTPSGATSHSFALYQGYSGPLVRINGHVFKDPQGTVHVKQVAGVGPTAISNPATIGKLKTTIEYDFMANGITRVLVKMKNVGTRSVTRTVEIGTLFPGSPAVSIHHSSAAPDPTLEEGDVWFDTSPVAGPPKRPAALFARGDANIAPVSNPTGSGIYKDTYTLKVRRHKTVVLLYYVLGNPRRTGTTDVDAQAPKFNSAATLDTNFLLEGIPSTTRAQIVNWANVPPA